MCFSPEEYKDDIVSSPVKRFRPKPDLTNSNPDQNQFLLNLDLLESNLIDEYLSILRAQDMKKRQREFLYVPEVSDKKFRFVKHFLFYYDLNYIIYTSNFLKFGKINFIYYVVRN